MSNYKLQACIMKGSYALAQIVDFDENDYYE